MSVESYMHRYAKAVLASWLRDWASRADGCGFLPDEFRDWAPFRWRVNRGPPHYGVWEEWPICGDSGVSEVWDETHWSWVTRGVPIPNVPWDQDWEPSEADDACDKVLRERPPTFKECLKLGTPPSVILDLAIQHKGALSVGFEVVHRNDISERKLERLKPLSRSCVAIYRVPAHWILAQVGMPKVFVGERIV